MKKILSIFLVFAITFSILPFVEVTSKAVDASSFDGCLHNNTTTTGKTDATCSSWGFSGEIVCNDCGVVVAENSSIDLLPHNFIDGVCDDCGALESELVESEHDYSNNMDESWTIYRPGVTTLYITFSTKTKTESCDYIYIYDGDDNQLHRFYGNDLAGKTIAVNSDTVRIRLVSDSSVTYYGFAVVCVRDNTVGCCNHTNKVTLNYEETTCFFSGYSGDEYCSDCGTMLSKGSHQAALSHNFVDGTCVNCGTLESDVKTTYNYNFLSETITKPGATRMLVDILISIEAGYFFSNYVSVYDGDGNEIFYTTQLIGDCQITEFVSSDTVTIEISEDAPNYLSISVLGVVPYYDECSHSDTILHDVVAVGCENDGYSGDVYCKQCRQVISEGRVITKTGHKYTNDICENCGVSALVFSVENGEATLKNVNSDGSKVVIPSSYEGFPVTAIGDSAFKNRTALVTIVIPSTVKSIGSSAFYGCSSLEEVNIQDLSSWLDIDFDNYSANPCYYSKALTVSGSPLTEIIIPEGTTEIKQYAFYNCSGITSVSFANSVNKVGDDAFYGCSGITQVNIPSLKSWVNIDFYDYFSNPCYYSKSLSIDGNKITEIVLPDDITEIKPYTFCNCSEITGTLTIPTNVVSIGEYSFYNCKGFTELILPVNLESIGSCAFYGCNKLSGALNIPECVSGIGTYCFQNCTGITQLILPKDITVIEFCAFKGCSGISGEIVIPEGVTSINSYAFENCSGITKITIPDGLTRIYDYAFSNCSQLASVNFPDTLSYVGESVVYNTALYNDENNWENGLLYIDSCLIKADNPPENAYIKDTTKLIANNRVFAYESVSSVKIPSGITKIPTGTFEYSYIDTIILPSTIECIEYDAFRNCSNFSTVYYEGTEEEWSEVDVKDSYYEDYMIYEYIWDRVQNYHYEFDDSYNPGICIGDGTNTVSCLECNTSETFEYKKNSHVFENGRCKFCNIQKAILIESSHPYDNNVDEEYIIEKTGATSVSILFSEDTFFENSYDKLYIYDYNDILIGEYTGSELSSTLITVSGDVVKLRLVSDSSVSKYGFRVEAISATFENCEHTDTVREGAVEPTCTTEGESGNLYCSICDELIEKSSIVSATGHSFGDWEIVSNPTCTQNGVDKTTCECGLSIIRDGATVLLDNSLYPESNHNYANNIKEEYDFSFVDAKKLSLTFSAETKTENSYDYIYIYGQDDNLVGKYSGTSLASQTIDVPGDKFKLKLTSDGSNNYYGFSFDSIVAHFDLPENMLSTGHTFGDWVVDRLATYTQPGERHRDCLNCDETETDSNVGYQTYSVMFNVASADCEENSREIISGATIGELPEITKTGYIFRGWTYTNGGTDFATPEDIVTKDLTLYPSWELIVPQSLAISTLPLKTGYCVGDELETRGLKLLVTYTDGSEKTITSGFETIYDFSSSGNKDVVVGYTEKGTTVSTSYSVYVNEPARIYSDTAEVNAGETIDVPVYIENNPGVAGFTIYMEYDDTVFTPVCVNGDDISGYGMLDDNIGYAEDNVVQVSWSGTENYYEDGELFSITFEVSADSTVRGDYEFAISYAQSDTFDENTNDIVLVCENALVSVINDKKAPAEIGGSSVEATAGQYIDIPVNVLNNDALSGSDVVIKYNSEVFTFSKVVVGLATVTVDDSTDGELIVNLNNVKADSEGTLFKVRFAVKEYISGEETLTIASSLSDVVTDDITVNITNPSANMPAVVYSDNISGNIGDTVLVPVYISNNHGMLGFKIRVTFDSALLTPAAYCKAETIVSDCGTVSNNISANLKKGRNYFDIIFYGDDEFCESGKMFTLKFTLNKTAPVNTGLQISYLQEDTFTEINGVEAEVALNCKNVNFDIGGAFVEDDIVYLNKMQKASTIDLLSWLPSADESYVENIETVNGNYYGTGTTFDYVADGVTQKYSVVVKGDIDGDGVIDVLDVVHSERASNDNEELSSVQQNAADLNCDSEITVEDYSASVNLALV